MTFEKVFVNELVKAYIEAYGVDSWNAKTEEEKSETIHELLGSFLTVAKKRAGR